MAGPVLASPLLRLLQSSKIPAAQPARAWRSMLLKDPGVPNPEFNPAQLTLPGMSPAKTILSGRQVPNVPGVSPRDPSLGALQQLLIEKELRGGKTRKDELLDAVRKGQPEFYHDVYGGASDEDIESLARQMAEDDADWAWRSDEYGVSLGEPEIDRVLRAVRVPLHSDVTDLDDIEIPFSEIRARRFPNMTQGALTRMNLEQSRSFRQNWRDIVDQIAERKRAKEEEWLRQSEAEYAYQDLNYYEDRAREQLGEGPVSGLTGGSQYRSYVDDVADPTYHEYVMYGEHPDFDLGSVDHFGDDRIVAHILANKGKIIEMQSDAAQNALEAAQEGADVPNLLFPRSSDALMATLKGYLQWAVENKVLGAGEALEFPAGHTVARRWGQPTGPVTFRGAKIEPSGRVRENPEDPSQYYVSFDADHPWASKRKLAAKDQLGRLLGEHANLLTQDILDKGGTIRFPEPYQKEVGLKAAYDAVLPNAINAAFKKYNIQYGPDRKIILTPELLKAIERGEMSAFACGGRARRAK